MSGSLAHWLFPHLAIFYKVRIEREAFQVISLVVLCGIQGCARQNHCSSTCHGLRSNCVVRCAWSSIHFCRSTSSLVHGHISTLCQCCTLHPCKKLVKFSVVYCGPFSVWRLLVMPCQAKCIRSLATTALDMVACNTLTSKY